MHELTYFLAHMDGDITLLSDETTKTNICYLQTLINAGSQTSSGHQGTCQMGAGPVGQNQDVMVFIHPLKKKIR